MVDSAFQRCYSIRLIGVDANMRLKFCSFDADFALEYCLVDVHQCLCIDMLNHYFLILFEGVIRFANISHIPCEAHKKPRGSVSLASSSGAASSSGTIRKVPSGSIVPSRKRVKELFKNNFTMGPYIQQREHNIV